MKRDLINEDSNQFGPGTDLIICLLALLIIFVFIVSYLYSTEKQSVAAQKLDFEKQQREAQQIRSENEELKRKLLESEEGGKFKLAGDFLGETFFEQEPFTKLKNQQDAEVEVLNIVEKYRKLSANYPFIFVIGHANEVGIRNRPDLSYKERLEWNWGIAGARAAVIANLLQENLTDEERDKIVVVSTGEFDLKNPQDPIDLENAYVEVYFGKEWKPKSSE